jgi:signal transduction histidine kinase/DNA-binding response OmpR family regulator
MKVAEQPVRILYVDDYPLDRELVRDALEKENGGFQVTEAASRSEFEARLAEGNYDLVLTDFNILGFEGLQVISVVQAKNPRIPVVIVTGTGSEEVAVEAMKRGAADYVIKTPHHIQRLPRTIRAAIERKRLQDEREQAEKALRESEGRYHSLYASMSEGVALHEILYDESGSPCDYRILDFNPAFGSIFGLAREHTLGRKASEIFETEALSYLDTYAKVVTSGQSATFQATFESVEKSFQISVFSPADGKFATLFEDISERLRLEAQLFQAQRLESIGRLAGGVAHDFNNLLTAITGYSQMLLLQIEAQNPMRGKLDLIKKAADRASALTGQLLAFSRKQLLQPQVLELNALIANIDKMLRRIIGEDIELVTMFGPNIGRIKADPTQLEQVMLNLVVNARDAMSNGGKIVVETSSVELDDAYARRHVGVVPGRYVMLAVSDKGCGMDAEVLKHIFEPFYTTKKKGKGTGLGLSTVYGIVKQSGGNIWVYSETGQGTSFKIYLPEVEDAVEETKTEESRAEVSGGKETVLLAEDEEFVRNFVKDVLQKYGYTVLEAQHGSEALRIGLQHSGPIHLLLTDVVMPRMSGQQLAKQMATLRPTVKVLYMSGYTESAIVHHGVLDSNAPFVQKPFTGEALARRVREVLDSDSDR